MRIVPLLNKSRSLERVLVALSLSLSVVACRKRTFGDSPRNTQVKQVSASSTGVDAADLLVDSPEFLKGIPVSRQPGHYLVLQVGSASSFQQVASSRSPVFEGDTLVRVPDATNKATLKAFRRGDPMPSEIVKLAQPASIVASQNALDPRPARFGAATVLEVLRANRKAMSRIVEGGTVQVPTLFGMSDELKKAAPSFGQDFDLDPASYFSLSDPRKTFSSTMCEGNVVNYLSDLRFHYQCQIPAVFRGCHRRIVGMHFDIQKKRIFEDFVEKRKDEAQTLDALRQANEDDLKHAVAFCRVSGDVSAIPSDTLQKYENTLGKNELQVLRPAFEAFYKSQIRSLTGGTEVNMFDYIMSSGTFDFDYEQQQAVLNAFYGDMAKPSPGSTTPVAFNPADPAQCNALREARVLTDDENGMHCLPTTLKRMSLYSSGR